MAHSRLVRFLWLLVVVVLAGCEGYSGPKTSTVAGTVLDLNNQPVRGARVWTVDGTTTTSPTGAYVLPRTRQDEVLVSAEIKKGDIWYRGRTVALTTADEQTNSVNIVVASENQEGRIEGYVHDRYGYPLEHASVFAYSGAGSSQRCFTNGDGWYALDNVIAGITYRISAGGPGYASDQDVVVVTARQTRQMDFVVRDGGLTGLTAPTNLFGMSWVSPVPSRSGERALSLDVARSLINPIAGRVPKARSGKTVTSKSRARTDMIVEVDLEWDEQQFPDLLGYGVYRANSATGNLIGVDYLPEPLAAYYVDQSINPASTYSYALTTLGVLYPNYPAQTESALSNRFVVETLNPIDATVNNENIPTFSWTPASGADHFAVFLFDEYPSIGVSSLWSSSIVSGGTSLTYGGVSLQRGRTYYYFVVGLGDYDSASSTYLARTISPVRSFKH